MGPKNFPACPLYHQQQSHILQASAYGHLGRNDDAKAAVARYKATVHQQGTDKLSVIAVWGASNYKDTSDFDRVIDGLRKGGVLE